MTVRTVKSIFDKGLDSPPAAAAAQTSAALADTYLNGGRFGRAPPSPALNIMNPRPELNTTIKGANFNDAISASGVIHTPAGGGAKSTGSKDDSAVSVLKELIKSLQAQLVQAEQQMALASRKSAQAVDGVLKDTTAGPAAEVNQISAAIQMATAELVQLMLTSGQTRGLVDAQA